MNGKTEVTLLVNGEERTVTAWPMARLLDVLREECGLTGTKEGCGEGECGACAVRIDGVMVNSCLVPVVQAVGHRVETIEGLSARPENQPVCHAFVECNGAQCGICTPGMIVAAVDLLDEDPEPSDAAIREALAGNLCRCTGYMKIVEAVREAALARRELA